MSQNDKFYRFFEGKSKMTNFRMWQVLENLRYIKIAFFGFLLPFFEALRPKKWYTLKTYFKRKTYILYNVVFGSSKRVREDS